MSLNSKTMNGIIEMHEKALEDNINGLKKVREELQVAETNNLAFSKRIIQELELARNQVFNYTPKAPPQPQATSKLESSENQKRGRGRPTGSTKQNIEQQRMQKEATDAKNTPAQTPKRTFRRGIQFEDLKLGDGPEATSRKMIGMYYKGKLKNNGKLFDSCLWPGKPFKFRLGAGEVIKGWDVGIEGMKVGGKRRLIIPPAMAYGAKGALPDIPANSHLVFEVECKAVN